MNKPRFFRLAAFFLVFTAPPLLAVAGEVPASASDMRDVWIADAMLDTPFCRVRVPAGWKVAGNVVWTYARPVMSPSVWIRLVDTGTGRIFESVGPVGYFYWIESTWITPESKDRSRNPKYGLFSAEENAYFLNPRSGLELLTEFVRPLVAKVTPGAKVLWIRDRSPRADESGSALGIRPEYDAGHSRNAWRKQAGTPPRVVTGAGMLVEESGGHSLFSTTASVWNAGNWNMDVSAVRWEWSGIAIATAPAVSGSGAPVDETVFPDCIALNPEWLRKAGELVQKRRNAFHPGNTWPLIDFDKYRAQAWQSGKIVERPVVPAMSDAAGSPYAAPAPGAVEHTPDMTRGYANAVVAALVLGESPYGSAIDSLKEFD